MSDPIGEFEFMVLAAVMRAGEGAYGVPVREMIARTTGRDVSPGAVYATLQRLERKGLVSSWRGDPTPERGGRARRYFAVEPRGVDALRLFLRDHLAIVETLDLERAT